MVSPKIEDTAIERWHKLHNALSSLDRRMLLYSLIDIPNERRLPLPDAAMGPETSLDANELTIHLQHNHLPKLAEYGYIRWERDPFCVQRGPYFEEVETVFGLLIDSIDQFPKSLVEGCEIYEDLYEDARQ